MRRELQTRKPIKHLSNGCGRPAFDDGIHNLFPDEIGAAEIEERGECMVIKANRGGGTERTNNALKIFVKFIEKIGVGRLRGGGSGGGQAKRVRQPVVIERQAAEEDLGNSVLVVIAVPTGRGNEAFSTVVNGGGEDVLYGGAATVIKLFIIIFNFFNLLLDFIGLFSIRFDKGGETGNQGFNLTQSKSLHSVQHFCQILTDLGGKRLNITLTLKLTKIFQRAHNVSDWTITGIKLCNLINRSIEIGRPTQCLANLINGVIIFKTIAGITALKLIDHLVQKHQHPLPQLLQRVNHIGYTFTAIIPNKHLQTIRQFADNTFKSILVLQLLKGLRNVRTLTLLQLFCRSRNNLTEVRKLRDSLGQDCFITTPTTTLTPILPRHPQDPVDGLLQVGRAV
ncbi:uncharacterized protein BcabD6B2_55230 [Babesia caballi]|uniref:Uncharacterized protein n=1 Tax=Babesia caballi TaxID=5871 RepID=A0AAV4M2H8_BABCB|nr:hypothetical protein BcabD6B2_55230 [Babesia caballi]